ncbi:non-specific lipid-transfer protein 1-like [Eucalyptus grandis]|uniref:non-specific lipid-transfer protein 1-like n=1 Tax=Eucalyptus grandis TaxID=71139 RepID=UPI000525F74D|nr:non-specific lipid-transfer protein 1-like [Eucalyptus grandis]
MKMANPRLLKATALAAAAAAVVCMVVANAPPAAAQVSSCNQVVNTLMPCVSYVLNGGAVPPDCCSGIQSLYSAAKTTADRQGVCNCLKSAINGIPYNAYSAGLAAGLPAKCGVNIPYKISLSTDCKSVK